MCGIVGIYNYRSGRPVTPELITEMANVMSHRGPDDLGVDCFGPVGFGHRRLSIIDLTASGHQPMSDAEGRYWLIFNGEIYNYVELRSELAALGHSFRSQSDSEVLLAGYRQWGSAMLERLNGMFAFAIWDKVKQTLFLARDRLGVKPLYLTETPDGFAWASEIKAFLKIPGFQPRPNLQGVGSYFLTPQRCIASESTFFAGVRKLLPGHFAVVSDRGMTVTKYWDLGAVPISQEPEATQAGRLLELLTDSVRIRMRSDVPVGFHLSGGLDSSSIVALAHRLGYPVISFSGAFGEGARYDERQYINTMVEAVRSQHHVVVPSVADAPAVLERIVWHMDEPAVGPGVIPQYFLNQLVAQSGVTVVLGGQGADEILGGYARKYAANYLRDWLAGVHRERPLLNPYELTLNVVAILRQSGLTESARLLMRRLQYRGMMQHILTPEFREAAGHGAPPLLSGGQPRGRLERELLWDTENYLPGLLQVEDRTSMAVSIESRQPFLDYRLVEYAHSISGQRRLKNLTGKYVLREAMRGILPEKVRGRRDKKGFPTPIAEWFRGPLADFSSDMLLSGPARSRGLFRTDQVEAILKQHRTGVDNSSLIWTLLNVELWHRTFVDHD